MVAPVVKKPRSRLTPADEAHEHALAQVEEQFRDFDLVWAKVAPYPWWPAVLFHNWEAVRDAGIPTLERLLVLPEPSIVPVLDADGKDTGRTRLLRHCVVMFVDQFNFSVVELDSRSVGSFLAYYKLHTDAMARNKKAGKYRAQFRIALDKALRMLHMGDDFNPDDLPLLEPIQVEQPPKKRRTEAARPPQSKRRNDVTDAWEGEWESQQEDDGDDSDEYKPRSKKRSSKKVADSDSSETPAPKRTGSKKSAQSKRDSSNTKSKGIVKRSEKQGKTAARSHAADKAATKADAAVVQDIKQKKPRKEKKDTAVDLTQMADSDAISDDSKEPAVMTPLSSIWTTKVPVESPDATPTLAFKQDFVWDSSVFCDNDTSSVDLISAGVNGETASVASSENPVAGSRDRPLSKRQGRSMQQSQIRQNLMSGNLDPHTMVQCESYKLALDLDSQNSRSRGAANLPPPFKVIVHPDATFVCDLHAHLATCEIIGFLGGKWDEETKTLYVQAAFPCRSLMIDGDDGSTDVEMDPGSEIELRGIINDAELEVVGWYHSHPAFAPDPSIRDIENQASYQQLFKRTQQSPGNEKAETSEPFVGLIVGTYDTRRDTPVSLFRYFHVRGEKVSGGARREIFMPYEFIPERRHYRQVVNDMASHKIRGLPIYPAVLKALMLSQSFRPATSLSSPISKEDESESQLISVSKSSPVRKKAPTSVRKRKQSADISVGEGSGKRGKRVRKKKTEESTATEEIDLTMDDDNEAAIQEEVPATDSSVEIIDVTRNGDNSVEMQSGIDNNANVIEMGESQFQSDRTTANEDHPDRTTANRKVDSKNDQPICEQAATNIATAKTSNGEFKLPEDKVKTADDGIGRTKANSPVTTSLSNHTATATATENVSLPANNQSLNHKSTHRRTIAADITTLSSKPKPPPTVIVETSSAVVRGATSSPSSSVTSNGSGGRRRNRKPSVTNKNKWRTDRSPQSESAANQSENMASPLNAFITIGSSRTSSTRSEATPPSPAMLEAMKQKDEKESLREIAKDPEYFVFGETDVKAVASSSPVDSSEMQVIASADITISSNTPATADDCSTDDDIEIVAVDESKPVVDEIVPCSQGSGLSDATPVLTTSDGHSGGDRRDVVEEQQNNFMLTYSDISLAVSERLDELVHEVARRSVLVTIKHEDATVEEPKSTDGPCGSATVIIDGNKGDLSVETESMKTEDVSRETELGEAIVGVQTIDRSEQSAEAASRWSTPDALEPKQELLPEAKDSESPAPAAPGEKIKTEDVPAEHITTKTTAPTPEPSEKVEPTTALEPLLFGRDRKYEDVRTSLERMEQLKLEKPSLFALHVKNARTPRRQSERSTAVESNPKPNDHLVEEAVHSPEEQLEAHLTALRSRYGDGMFGCIEQVITLVDYYRDFERRIDLLEPWKAKMNKLRKIEASLSEYVQYLNLSVDLRQAFIDDLIGYLELSWELTRHAR